MLDLLQTGKYGVLTNQKLLGTTSNNITNVNTLGYTRQQTNVYTSAIDWGVGATYTRRMYDQYAQRELFRDQGNVGFYDAYAAGLGTVDHLLSNEDTSVGTSINSLFSSMQEAVQNTTSLANRRELLTQFENLVDRFHTLNYNIKNQLNDINAKVGDTAKTINDLVKAVYDVNRQVRNLGTSGTNSDIGLQLLDKRDQLVNELSTYVDISVTSESDGSLSLYLGNGQLLVNGDTYGQLEVTKNKFDPSFKDVNLTFQNPKPTTIELGHDQWGGRLGGYLNSSDEIRQSMRDLGRLAIAFADAVNEQNKGGITLEGLAGSDLVTIPSVQAASKNPGESMKLTFNPGEGSDVRNCDYKVVFEQGSDKPVVYMVEDGKETKVDPDLVEKTQDGKYTVKGHGITLDFSPKIINDLQKSNAEFYVQPTVNAGFDIKCNITKPEEFAFASAIVTNTNKHDGNAVAEMVGVFHTASSKQEAKDNGLGIYIGEDGKPHLADNAPAKVVFEGEGKDGSYVIYNSKGEKIGSAPASCNGQNIFANATWEAGIVPKDAKGFPGYEVNFTGTVNNGASFEIAINDDGYNDNSNGNLLAQLQQEDLVFSTESVKGTFTQSYADLTSDIGSAVMSATTDLKASMAKHEQSYNMFYSVAGVNLDEEAANLIRYQQSYSACAKIISASQTVFDALIQSI